MGQSSTKGKRPRVWPVPVAGKHVGGRGTRSGIFPKWLHKMCEGEGLGSRGYHSFQSLDFANSSCFLTAAGCSSNLLLFLPGWGRTSWVPRNQFAIGQHDRQLCFRLDVYLTIFFFSFFSLCSFWIEAKKS